MLFCGVTSDLALEAHEALRAQTGQEIPGIAVEKRDFEYGKVTYVKILNDQGAQQMGKPPGNYITIEAPIIRDDSRYAHPEVIKEVARSLGSLLRVPQDATVLVVGLGNWNATPDALGPRVIDYTLVTRHIFKYAPQAVQPGMRQVSAIAPGVLGITGIETDEIVKGIVGKINPSLIITIDALAAGAVERIATSIQICDTGIRPGSGMGGKSGGITRETMGVPVISIGVPTVVHAALIAQNSINKLYQAYNKPVPPRETLEPIVKDLLEPFGGNLMVTPKEIDILIQNCAKIIAAAITDALHPEVNPEHFGALLQ
ncbi:MAG: GPR endopeptidase [Peptococcaceae bacterium]|nr:GPR endopeptidase [Peptococcaceae bacterium]